mgnify:CR=1 FL=1
MPWWERHLTWILVAILAGCAIYCIAISINYTQQGPETISLPLAHQRTDATGRLSILNWENYFAESTLRDFEQRTGVKTVQTTFSDEDEMLSMVLSNPSNYDIIITSSDTVATMIKTRLLRPINRSSLTNLQNLDSRFLLPKIAPDDIYAVPYLWGTTGIAVNTRFIPTPEESWNLLWNPDYRGRIAMLNSLPECFGAALRRQGHSLNSTSPAENEAAAQSLQAQTPLLAGHLATQDIQDKLVAGELWAAHIYSGDALALKTKIPDLRYFLPREGFAVWIDCLCITRDATNIRSAEQFINYILEPAVIGKITNELRYANCNRASRDFIDAEVLNSPEIHPAPNVLASGEFFETPLANDSAANPVAAIRNACWAQLARIIPSKESTP